MPISQARVATERAERYLKQLCTHFSHKVPVELTDRRGEVDFPFGRAVLEATDEALLLQVSGSDTAELERAEQVVKNHLERFATKDGLTVTWSRTTA